MSVQSKAEQLRDALLDTLIDAVENGAVVELDDGTHARRTPTPQLLTVALGAVKALAPNAAEDKDATAKAASVSKFLERYQPTPASAKQ